jgi:hypothetical protein
MNEEGLGTPVKDLSERVWLVKFHATARLHLHPSSLLNVMEDTIGTDLGFVGRKGTFTRVRLEVFSRSKYNGRAFERAFNSVASPTYTTAVYDLSALETVGDCVETGGAIAEMLQEASFAFAQPERDNRLTALCIWAVEAKRALRLFYTFRDAI